MFLASFFKKEDPFEEYYNGDYDQFPSSYEEDLKRRIARANGTAKPFNPADYPEPSTFKRPSKPLSVTDYYPDYFNDLNRKRGLTTC